MSACAQLASPFPWLRDPLAGYGDLGRGPYRQHQRAWIAPRHSQRASTSGALGIAAQSTGQIVGAGGTAAATVAPILVSHGVIAASTAALAVPIIGAAVAAVTVGISLFLKAKAYHNLQNTTAEYVRKVEPLMLENLNAYMAGPHTRSSQAQALANFDALWADIVNFCDQPSLGAPGQACWEERKRASECRPNEYPHCGRYDFFAGSATNPAYRDPIANDPNVVEDSQAAAQSVVSAVSSMPAWAWLVAGAGLILAGVML